MLPILRDTMTSDVASLRRYGWFLLLGFVPIAIVLEWIAARESHRHLLRLSCSPSCRWPPCIGRATDVLADRLGGGIGGLLNATFGNAAELIIGALALREGLIDLVKASLTGSIIGNVLLVFGAVGVRRRPQAPDPALQPHRGRHGHDDAAAEHDRPGGPGRVSPARARQRRRRRAEARYGNRRGAVRRPIAPAWSSRCARIAICSGDADGQATPPAREHE